MAFDITGLGSVADFASELVKRFFPPKMTDAEKAQARIQLQEMLQKREDSLIEAKKSVLVAELQQGDSFTKRARPTVIYAGLGFIALVHVLLPMIAWVVLIATGKPLTDMPDISLPGQFWMAWGGICTTWVIGRSVERRGMQNKLVKMITGSA